MTGVTYRYPLNSVAGDYARAAIGFVFTAVPAMLFPMALVPRVILLALGAVFLGFGLQTALRHRTCFTVTDQYILAQPRGVRLQWRELTDVRLGYYTTHRESKRGWMQLTLKDRKRSLRMDSRLDGFIEVAQRAAESAYENHLLLDPTTMTNLNGLNVRLPETHVEQGGR
ncbi:MAG: hypothetical protein ACE5LB_02615 [Acidiferrobacterales bacterium]